ncbi:MAG TPA: SDR family oxidoreductase, partial [Anaerolineales bacterium]|nr:SDR family oxidoreductase [Anaerolineales bacterium]
MGLLEGKNALVFGLANDKSIAWGIIQAFLREGANIGISYAGEIMEKRVKPLAEKVNCQWVEECDVTKDDQIEAVVKKAEKHFGKIDILVHSIAYAGRDELSKPYHQTSREGFRVAM